MPDPRDRRLALIVIEGRGRGASFPLAEGRALIGRDEAADVPVDDPLCSRRHAEVTRESDRLSARDLGSRNGTLLNGEPLTSATLDLGDELRIGDVALLVVDQDTAPPTLDSDLASTLGATADGLPIAPGRALIGASRAMQKVHALVLRVGPFEAPVLVTGESGTGKELVAEAIHRRSPRRDEPFVVMNCACLEGPLADSALFGHERGAFTGAADARPGCLERAGAGTLFLDEIGELPRDTQAKLLRVAEGKPFSRVGGNADIAPRARLVAATNRDLDAMARAGTFRDDLLFRLRGVTISVPPLRERPEDLPPLVDHFLRSLRKGGGVRLQRFSQAALDALARYRFPGNVRELSHIVARTAMHCGVDEARPEHLPEEVRAAPARGPDAPPGTAGAAEPPRDGAGEQDEDFKTLRGLQREVVEETLRRTGGNKSRAAKLLGIHRASLYKMLARWGIQA